MGYTPILSCCGMEIIIIILLLYNNHNFYIFGRLCFTPWSYFSISFYWNNYNLLWTNNLNVLYTSQLEDFVHQKIHHLCSMVAMNGQQQKKIAQQHWFVCMVDRKIANLEDLLSENVRLEECGRRSILASVEIVSKKITHQSSAFSPLPSPFPRLFHILSLCLLKDQEVEKVKTKIFVFTSSTSSPLPCLFLFSLLPSFSFLT